MTRLYKRPSHALHQVTELPVTEGPFGEQGNVDTAATAASFSPGAHLLFLTAGPLPTLCPLPGAPPPHTVIRLLNQDSRVDPTHVDMCVCDICANEYVRG